MAIGDHIRDLRWGARLKQVELARRAGIAQNTLSQIELGNTVPSVPTLEKIARGLGVSTDELLREPALPLAEASETGRPPLIERKAVQDWLRQVGASFALMAREDFEELVVETLDSEGLEELAEEIDDERGRIERELGKPAARKALFPPDMRGLSGTKERVHEAMRPAREAGQLRLEIGRKYTTKKLAIENYSLRLYAADEAENYLLLVRPGMPEATRRGLEEARQARQARLAAFREELAGVGA
jgi:transcriptional regulator with XRE-family HTH domain